MDRLNPNRIKRRMSPFLSSKSKVSLSHTIISILTIILVSSSQLYLINAFEESSGAASQFAISAQATRQASNSVESASASSSPSHNVVPVAKTSDGASPAPSSPVSQSSSAAMQKVAAQKAKQQLSTISKKASAIASQQNYDKYQLKASNSNSHHQNSQPEKSLASSTTNEIGSSDKPKTDQQQQQESNKDNKQSSGLVGNSLSTNGSSTIQKKAAQGERNKSSSSFSLFKKLLPSFMTSAGPGMAAVAGVAASAFADKHQMSHSRSSSQLANGVEDIPLLAKASGKIINLLTSAASSKKSSFSSSSSSSSSVDHAASALSSALGSSGGSTNSLAGSSSMQPSSFLSSLMSATKNSLVKPTSIDRQAAGGLTASSLLSNPLGLGLLFSAPLIPSLLLTPLAIAGLSPAMSAINNFFGDDDDSNSPASTAANSILSHQSSPLSVLTGPSSPLSSILQGNPQQAAANIQSALSNAASSSSGSGGLALQAMQTFLGPPATTEKPLFNPGLFASQGIQNAMASLDSGSSSSSSSSQSIGGASNSPIRNFFTGGGGGSGSNSLIQTAASMISPTFAAPPSSSSAGGGSSSTDSDDGPGFMQAASEVFDKVANYISPLQGEKNANSAIASQASGSPAPWTDLLSLSSLAPLSSLLSGSSIGSASSGTSSSSSSSTSSSIGSSASVPAHQKVGFFTTLKNVYELFTSSFLRRQEVGDNSNECQQRLICELHQRAMNSKLFRRSVQANLMELANFDRNLQEQIKVNPMQARVDTDTKAMLNDFLKATNNFKNGRELVNCSKMFPKCSRVALLSTANAHLSDVTGNKGIGKFSSLMKKMKFKVGQQQQQQQQQQQWKWGKAAKVSSSASLPQMPRVNLNSNQQVAFQSSPDYFQVAPSTQQATNKQPLATSQMTPAESLKFVQQMMIMSQPQQSQQVAYNQNQQVVAPSASIPIQQQQSIYNPTQSINNYNNNYNPQQQQQPQPQPQPQYSLNNQQQPISFSDGAINPMYSSATESPFYPATIQQQQQQQPQQPQMLGISQDMSGQQQQQQQQQQHTGYPQQQTQTSTSVMPDMSSNNKMKPIIA